MTNTKTACDAAYDAAWPPLPTFPVVIHGDDGSYVTHKLPPLPGVNQAVYEMLGTLLECFGNDLYQPNTELTPDEIAQVTVQRVFERLAAPDPRFGNPDHKRIYAERAGVAIWEFVRIAVNTIERTRRHDWNKAHPDYFAAAADDAFSKMQGVHLAARRALRALQIVQPSTTPVELIGQVVDALAGVMEHPCREAVPSVMPMY